MIFSHKITSSIIIILKIEVSPKQPLGTTIFKPWKVQNLRKITPPPSSESWLRACDISANVVFSELHIAFYSFQGQCSNCGSRTVTIVTALGQPLIGSDDVFFKLFDEILGFSSSVLPLYDNCQTDFRLSRSLDSVKTGDGTVWARYHLMHTWLVCITCINPTTNG